MNQIVTAIAEDVAAPSRVGGHPILRPLVQYDLLRNYRVRFRRQQTAFF